MDINALHIYWLSNITFGKCNFTLQPSSISSVQLTGGNVTFLWNIKNFLLNCDSVTSSPPVSHAESHDASNLSPNHSMTWPCYCEQHFAVDRPSICMPFSLKHDWRHRGIIMIWMFTFITVCPCLHSHMHWKKVQWTKEENSSIQFWLNDALRYPL